MIFPYFELGLSSVKCVFLNHNANRFSVCVTRSKLCGKSVQIVGFLILSNMAPLIRRCVFGCHRDRYMFFPIFCRIGIVSFICLNLELC